jgi:hypothetical protein
MILAVGYVDVGHWLRPFLGTKKERLTPKGEARMKGNHKVNARIKTTIAAVLAAVAALAWWKKKQETDETEDQDEEEEDE